MTARSLVDMVRVYPRYFADVRANTLRLTGAGEATVLARIRASYDRIEALYPEAVFPTVTFLVGRFSTGGTVRETGILIGTELFALGATTPLDELPQSQRDRAADKREALRQIIEARDGTAFLAESGYDGGR